MSLLVVLHGVNLGLLGERPVAHYGRITLQELEAAVVAEARRWGWECVCHQTDHEGEYVQLIHRYRRCDAMIANPGAWTHYSYAIHDALELVSAPVAEVHLSAVDAREEWRRVSVIADVSAYRVSGKGVDGYLEAIRELVALSKAATGTEEEG